MRLYAWWSGMPRQGRTGWTLVVFGTERPAGAAGAPITNKEWFVGVGMLVLIMIGTINIRMAEMRERRQGTLPLVDPNLRSRK